MIENVLFAGKDFPAGEQYLSTALDYDVTALMTKSEYNDSSQNAYNILEWNRSSIISAHSLVIQSENLVNNLDAAVLIFDAPHFASIYDEHEKNSIKKISDELILAYQFLSFALMERFILKKHGTLVFIHKSLPTQNSILKKNGEQNVSLNFAGPLLSSAQDAFTSFAENFACKFLDTAPQKVILVHADTESDNQICSWLCKKLQTTENNKNKVKRNNKDAVKWLSATGKETGALGFFKHF